MKRPVIGGILDSATEVIQRVQINLWQPGSVVYSIFIHTGLHKNITLILCCVLCRRRWTMLFCWTETSSVRDQLHIRLCDSCEFAECETVQSVEVSIIAEGYWTQYNRFLLNSFIWHKSFFCMSFHRETVRAVLAELVTATLVSTTGNPNFSNLVDWVNITSEHYIIELSLICIISCQAVLESIYT